MRGGARLEKRRLTRDRLVVGVGKEQGAAKERRVRVRRGGRGFLFVGAKKARGGR